MKPWSYNVSEKLMLIFHAGRTRILKSIKLSIQLIKDRWPDLGFNVVSRGFHMKHVVSLMPWDPQNRNALVYKSTIIYYSLWTSWCAASFYTTQFLHLPQSNEGQSLRMQPHKITTFKRTSNKNRKTGDPGPTYMVFAEIIAFTCVL